MTPTLLPPNATPLLRNIATSGARIGTIPVPLADLYDPARCPAPLLPWLAWSWSADEWNRHWTEAQKRATIAASPQIHRQKGTVFAMKSALAALDLHATLIEWHEPGENAQPYTFRLGITLAQTGIPDLRTWQNITAVIDSAKNARSHLAAIQLTGETICAIGRAGVVMIGETTALTHEHPLYFEAAKYGKEQTIAAVNKLHNIMPKLADPPLAWQKLHSILKTMSRKGYF